MTRKNKNKQPHSKAAMKVQSEVSTATLKVPLSNVIHVHIDRLLEMLRLYEKDRAGFFEMIPKLR